MKYVNDITESIGNTPLIQLQRVSKGIAAKVLIKLESMNPGGSLKDRIALQIINDAEKKGLLKKGMTIIESTGSGNTGIGLAMIAAVRGYKTIFTMPDKNSREKTSILKAYGAEVIICPTHVRPDDPRSYYKRAESLSHEVPNSFFANQYSNLSNANAHYLSTGPEIWEQTDGKVDYFFAGVGTGGTITGISKYLKEKDKNVKVIGVDPIGSIYTEYYKTKKIKTGSKDYLIEGIGEDFIPGTVDFSYVDDLIQVNDKDAYQMTRRLLREEGILVGSSSGAAVAAALQYAKQKKLSKNIFMVILLPDSGRNYLSKIFNDDWIKSNHLLE